MEEQKLDSFRRGTDVKYKNSTPFLELEDTGGDKRLDREETFLYLEYFKEAYNIV